MFSQFLPWKEAGWKTSKDIFLTTLNQVRKALDFITCNKNLEFWGPSHWCLVYIRIAANRFYFSTGSLYRSWVAFVVISCLWFV